MKAPARASRPQGSPRLGDRIVTAPDPFAEPDDDELLTSWERGFLASMDAWDGEPTAAQQAKLDEIQEALPMRRQLAREGKWPR